MSIRRVIKPLIALLFFASSPSPVLAAWPQYRGSASRMGLASGPVIRSPVVAWKRTLGQNVMIDASPVVGPDGIVYVGTEDIWNPLYALNPDGNVRWRAYLWPYTVRSTPAIRSDGSLWVVGNRFEDPEPKGRVFLVGSSGTIRRASATEYEGVGWSSPLLDSYGNAYYWYLPPGAGDLLLKFHSDYATSGSTSVTGTIGYDVTGEWSVCDVLPVCGFDPEPVTPWDTDPGWLRPSPALTWNSEIIAPSYETLKVTTSGHEIWEKGIVALTTVAHCYNGWFVGSLNGGLEKWRGDDKQWGVGLGGGYAIGAPACGRGVRDASDVSTSIVDDVYVSATDGYLYSYDYKGRFRWKRQIGPAGCVSQTFASGFTRCSPAAGPPTVIRDPNSGDQVIVVGSRWNLLYAFDRNGTALWTLSLDAPALGSPGYHDGRLYVATYNSVYEIRQAKLLLSPLLPGGLR